MRWPRTNGRGPGWPTSSVSTPDCSSSSSSNRSSPTTRRSASPNSPARGSRPEAGGKPASAVRRARRPRQPTSRRSSTGRHARLVEIVGPGGVGKTAVAIAAGRALSTSTARARRCVAGQTRGRGDRRRRGRHVGRRADVRWRGGTVRTAEEQRSRWSSSTTASTSSTRPRPSPSACSTPRPGCGSCAPARSRSTSTARPCSSSRRSPLADAVALFTRRAGAQRAGRATSTSRRCRRGSLPIARWSALGDRARRGAHQDVVDRGDHPPSRRSLQRVERPDQPPTGTPPGAQVDDRMELRAALPRRPARPVGVRHLRRRRPAAAVESVLEALEVPAAAAIDVVGRLASRSLVIVDDDGALDDRPLPAARQHPRVRARSDDRRRAVRAGLRRARRVVRRGGGIVHARACAAATKPSISPSPETERANIDAALAWSIEHDPLLALAIVNGFGWAWVVLGDSRGAQRILAALDAAGDAAPARDRANALLLAAWIEASTDRLELARDHIAEATELAVDDQRCRPAGALLATTSPTSCRITASSATRSS